MDVNRYLYKNHYSDIKYRKSEARRRSGRFNESDIAAWIAHDIMIITYPRTTGWQSRRFPRKRKFHFYRVLARVLSVFIVSCGTRSSPNAAHGLAYHNDPPPALFRVPLLLLVYYHYSVITVCGHFDDHIIRFVQQ